MKTKPAQQFGKFLGLWFAENARDLPWRRTHDPYKIWVSEIMLQQTQVKRVKDFYAPFLKRFPKIQDLALAKWEDVLESWRDPVPPGTPQVIAAQRRGLGYYRRARNMHKAAQGVVRDFGGKFPHTFEELKNLPGVGSYTAAAIASFAYGEKVPALDTNISRVFARVFGRTWENLKPGEKFVFAKEYMGASGDESGFSSRDFNYGLMDLGALVCNAKQPKCEECCFQKICAFAGEGRHLDERKAGPGRVYKLPRMARKMVFSDGEVSGYRKAGRLKSVPGSVKVAAGVLIHDGKVLIAKRPQGKPLAGLWEFPGGKVEHGEDERGCLKREFMEELGIEVSVRPSFFKADTEHEGVPIRLSFHRCSLLLGDPRSLEGQEFRWVGAEELRDFEFPAVNTEVVEILCEKKAMFYA